MRLLERCAEALWALLPGRDLGRRGERVAARHLRRQGLRLLVRNYRTPRGELDLVALAGETLVFVEVKSRTLSGSERGDPLERIDWKKRRRIRSAARAYLRRVHGRYQAYRCDAVAVEFKRGFLGRPYPASVRWYPAVYELD